MTQTLPWCGPDDLGGPCTDLDLPAETVDAAIALASDVLFWLTGSKWPGVRVETVRPMSSTSCGCWGGDPSDRARDRLRRRGCGTVRQQELGGYPLVSIEWVKIDGEVVPADRYRIDDRRYLTAVRTSATQDRLWWPSCQALDLPDTEVGTWAVRAGWGAAPPAAGAAAAAILSCEMAMAMAPESEDGPGCRLPASWTSITRAGVTVTRAAVQALAAEGLTGLPEVDLWLSSMKVAASRQGAAVIVPGRNRNVRRTGS